MKHLKISCLITFFFGLFIAACSDEGSTVGSKWVETSFKNVFTDTCTVELRTILADSIATSANSVAQIGRYKDSFRGDLKASFFTEYSLSKINVNGYAWYEFDSLTVTLYPSGDYLGDTLSTHTMRIHRLLEPIYLDLKTNYLYNTSSVPYDENNFETISYSLRPGRRQKIEKRIFDDFGKTLFNAMIEEIPAFDDQEKFRLYFPGLAFTPESDDCIGGFAAQDSSLVLTMYYRKLEGTSTEQTMSFYPNSSKAFNKIDHDLSNTPFKDLERITNYSLNSAESDNVAYLQGLAGMYISIDFPYLNNLLEQGQDEIVSIESAVLLLYPALGAYTNQTPLPPSLTLYTANQNDAIAGAITNSTGTSLQTGNLQENIEQPSLSHYSFDLTSFLQTNLGLWGPNRQKLMLRLPEDAFFSTVQSLILGDMNYPGNKKNNTVKLQVVYKAYNRTK